MEDDFVFQRRVDLSAGFKANTLEFCIDIAQRFDAHLESKGDSQCAFTCSGTLQLYLLRVFGYPDIDFRKRNVLLRVEILRELLIAEHLVADQNSLTRVNSTEPDAHQWSSTHGHVLAAVVFQKNQIVIPE